MQKLLVAHKSSYLSHWRDHEGKGFSLHDAIHHEREREREPSFLDSFSRIIDGLRFLRKVLYYKTGLFMVAGSKVRGPYYQQQQLFVKLTLTLVTTEEEKG